ncbi:vicilin-like seed storage protein [Prunus yedoensis var. nudiflora]|uniref:Vicilin-like seed storage protein n=1 Tax=Prunus yedoensis var. nudiflora TaxID=2094558 RepID=A0A314UIU3_PRUYE|nr:vicilin-like seed storage protein [Prunus yedoensis var. nudiflora]
MKRKKWSELEELTLLTKYSELLISGALAKLKTREKKFKPIADHVNSVHHLHDPVTFPFKWSWRDVSIKVQNMRHQYLGVKQKIRVSKDEFNWKDGENHWENFLKYKEVFGDVELDVKGKRACESESLDVFGDCGDLGFGIDSEDLEEEEDEEEEEEPLEDEEEEEDGSGDGDNGLEELGRSEGGEFGGQREIGDVGFAQKRKLSKVGLHRRLGLVSAQVLDLRDVVVKREERRRERECRRENSEAEREEKRKELECRREKRRNEREEWLEDRELELEEREVMWARKEFEKRLRLEREFDEERRRRMRMEEKREEAELEWRERMVSLQIEHEKQMMQMHAEACQNQMQILGVMARLVCQFFGSVNDGLGGGLGALPPQVLQNLQHPGDLGHIGKPEANSPSEFL